MPDSNANSVTSAAALRARWRRVARNALPWAVPAIGVLLWELASVRGWLSTRVLPEPWAVVKAFWALLHSGEIWHHMAVSSGRALAGLGIGGSLGLALGLLTGTFRTAETLAVFA